MAWYLNKALTGLRAEVDVVWPDRDRTSDGTIGDEAHQATGSDHNPDPDGSVDAWDMDIDGVDVWHIIDRFEQHEASKYWIYNRQIASRSSGWVREPYTGANPHDQHVHFNTREDYEDSTKPWGIGDDMPLSQDDINKIATAVHSANWTPGKPELLNADGRETAGGRQQNTLDDASKARELASQAVDAVAELREEMNTKLDQIIAALPPACG